MSRTAFCFQHFASNDNNNNTVNKEKHPRAHIFMLWLRDLRCVRVACFAPLSPRSGSRDSGARRGKCRNAFNPSSKTSLCTYRMKSAMPHKRTGICHTRRVWYPESESEYSCGTMLPPRRAASVVLGGWPSHFHRPFLTRFPRIWLITFDIVFFSSSQTSVLVKYRRVCRELRKKYQSIWRTRVDLFSGRQRLGHVVGGNTRIVFAIKTK